MSDSSTLRDVRMASRTWSPPAPTSAARSGPWSVYLVLMMLLVPVLKPVGPWQLTILDGLNAIAITAFLFSALTRRDRIEFPLIVPVVLAAIGSLVAVTNAESFPKAIVTMVQDAYLYLWFVVLVAVLRDHGDMKGLRLAWTWSANIAGGIGLTLLLMHGTAFWRIFGAKGQRAVGLFDGPNSLADYLMMSLFVVITLNGQTNRLVVWGSFVFQFVVLIATKSNGAMLSWMLGMTLWALMRALTRTRSLVSVFGVALLIGGLGIAGSWLVTTQVGAGAIREFQKKSFLGRFEQSAEGRGHIWERLSKTYAQHPLGIAPGNSSEQKLSVGHRERRMSYRSKEAHSDYLGYLVERGPLALLALVMIVVMPFFAAWAGLRKNPDPGWSRGVGGALTAAFCGGLLATSFHSFFMEKLHFRHYWVFLAMVYAIASAPPLVRAVTARKREAHASTNGHHPRPGATLPSVPALRS